MLSILGYAAVLFVIEIIFLIICTASIDMNKKIELNDVFGSLFKFYLLNVFFIAVLTKLSID